jgi:hypothetical protein
MLYVSKSQFIVQRIADSVFLHDTNTSIDLFSADSNSGFVIPTLSLSGDGVFASAVSVGHELVVASDAPFTDTNGRVRFSGSLSLAGAAYATDLLAIGGGAGALLSVGAPALFESGALVRGSDGFNIDTTLSV